MRSARGRYRPRYIPDRPKLGTYRPDFARYEMLKKRWVDRHPAATPEEYTAAMVMIAQRCGI